MAVTLAPTPVSGCTNPAHQYPNLAPMACPDCHGWLERDGSVMDRATMLKRYPFMASQLAATPAVQLPDYGGPSRGEKLLALNRLAGLLARTGLAIVLAALALALVVYLIVKLA